MKVSAGRTFFLQQGGHLWIVLSEPLGAPPSVIIVNFTSKRPGSDQTVVLGPQDHPFVRHPTVVSYTDTKLISVRTLEGLVAAGISTFHADCTEDLLARLREGLLRSPFTPQWLKEHGRSLF